MSRLTDPSDAWDKALEDFDYVVGTNLKGVFLCGRAVAPLMVARGEGHIVNIATDHIYTCGWPEPVDHTEAQACPWRHERRRPGWVGLDVYDASKWALNGLTQAWAKSLRQHGIRVNNLCMGATDSHMQRSFLGFDNEEPPAELLAKWMDPARVSSSPHRTDRRGARRTLGRQHRIMDGSSDGAAAALGGTERST